MRSLNLREIGYLEGGLLYSFFSKNEHNLFLAIKESCNIYCLSYNSKLELEDQDGVPYVIKSKVITVKILNHDFVMK